MELFIWFWAFDKRLVCCWEYGPRTFVYIWTMPALAALLTLGLSWTMKLSADDRALSECRAKADE